MIQKDAKNKKKGLGIRGLQLDKLELHSLLVFIANDCLKKMKSKAKDVTSAGEQQGKLKL
jgi:hypothetical protein